jgi:ABC-type glycerol-3-phosphate transport system substrate-binding protein
MFKRLLLALALVGALAACNTPAGTASPSGAVTSPSASGVVSSPADSGLASPAASPSGS